jgi:predicted Zn-dependent protease with MMP-like domain
LNRRAFERLVERAIASIPREFIDRVENLTFQVEDWPDADTLDEAGFDDPGDLLGFYRGWPLTERTHEYGSLPDVITIYRGPVENCVRESGDPPGKVIRETILHELAHHFGFSEEQMDEIEALWSGDPDILVKGGGGTSA